MTKRLRHIICLGIALLLLACGSSQFVIEKNPRKENPVDQVEWLKQMKKELETSRCTITLYEKEGQTYYEIYKPIEGAHDMKTTTLYDEWGNRVMSYGGLMPPARRAMVEQFFEDSEKKGIIWECTPKREKQSREK